MGTQKDGDAKKKHNMNDRREKEKKNVTPKEKTKDATKNSHGSNGKLVLKKVPPLSTTNAIETRTMRYFDIEMQRNNQNRLDDEILVVAEKERPFFFSCCSSNASLCDFIYVSFSCFWPCVILDIRQKLYGN